MKSNLKIWKQYKTRIINVIIITIIFTLSHILIGQNMSFAIQNSITDVRKISDLSISQPILHSRIVFESSKDEKDTSPPDIEITYPSYPPTLLSGNITLRGITNDSSGIKAISADAHTFPFNGTVSIQPALEPSLIPQGNFSTWDIPFAFKSDGVYRIVVTVRDNNDNLGYAETTLNIVNLEKHKNGANRAEPAIAFLRPTFTEAAYQENGFYNFYFKYGFPQFEKKITEDLNLLSVKMPRSVPEFLDEHGIRSLSNITALVPINGSELHDISYDYFPNPQNFWMPFIDNINRTVPNATLTIIRDEDVHDGHIFNQGNNKSNAFDILLLFHNEYATQNEYDNLRQFVSNGGTIVFIDANALYAEVNYDRNNQTITLVKGHSWEFDGKAAERSVPERWYNESKEWVGGNYLINAIETNIIFSNNMFNYTHFEEQFVNNPKAKIWVDYGIKFPADYIEVYSKKNELPPDKKVEDIVVATYTLNSGKGKVVMLGLTARLLYANENFMNFFDSVILPEALCPTFHPCYLD